MYDSLLDEVRGYTNSGNGRQRALAIKLLQLLDQNVSPSFRQLRELRQLGRLIQVCAKLDGNDGSCLWLRKYGQGHGLPVAPIGRKAMCPFVEKRTWSSCPGFSTMELEGARR